MKIEDIKVGSTLWSTDDGFPVVVSGVGKETVLGYEAGRRHGSEQPYDAADLTEIKTYPELWLNVYQNDAVETITVKHASPWPSLAEAERMTTPDVVARIHLATDGTLTLEDL